MRMRALLGLLIAALVVGSGVIMPPTADAHQPYCEFVDITFDTAWNVPDPSVSVAYYANLYPADDVDYFTFDADAGQDVFLSMTLPDIEGQPVDFVPLMAVFGPGLDAADPDAIPDRVTLPTGAGAFVVPTIEEPEHFYEPFGRRYYWQWQETTFSTPEDGTYTVAVWHPEQELGRYTFVIGKREVLGGDLSCLMAMSDYFTPLVAGETPYRDAESGDHAHDDDAGSDHPHDDSANDDHTHDESTDSDHAHDDANKGDDHAHD